MIQFRLPKIDATTPQGQVQQIKAYLQQLIPELQMDLEQKDREIQALKEQIQQRKG